MLNRKLAAAFLVALLLALPTSAARKVKDYSATIDDFKKIAVVAGFFETAHGYAVFPSIGKGGLGIGGSHGKGQVYSGGKVIGFTSTSDISIGAQAGGQAYSQIIFFENADALTRFTGGNFEFAASAEHRRELRVRSFGRGDRGAGESRSGGQYGRDRSECQRLQDLREVDGRRNVPGWHGELHHGQGRPDVCRDDRRPKIRLQAR
jgi:lipid-binding SYLF domain-containing protein